MRKKLAAFAAILALLLAIGCQQKTDQETMVSPVRFYYKTADAAEFTGATGYELREIAGHEEDYTWILDQYFLGPQSEGLTAPFQRTTALLSAELSGTQLRLTVTESLAELTGMDLTLACACITLTCLELPNVESVSIAARGSTLDGKHEMVLTRDDLLLEDLGASLIGAPYTLYFSDTGNRYLIGEEIQVDRNQENLPVYLIEHLIEGPSEAGLAETMPLETRLLELEVSEGVCSVDFSGEFLDNAPRTDLAQRMTVLSVTNTLTQLEEIDAVVISVDGQLLSRYGSMDVSQMLTFEEGAVGPARTGLNELDADLYLTIGESPLLSRLPVRIRQTANQVPAELLLQALLSYQDQNGYHSDIPEGTTLLSLQQGDNRYLVDLSGEFLSGEGSLTLAVRSVCTTLLAFGDCTQVQILVEGAVPEGDYGDLFAPHGWTDSWLAG